MAARNSEAHGKMVRLALLNSAHGLDNLGALDCFTNSSEPEFVDEGKVLRNGLVWLSTSNDRLRGSGALLGNWTRRAHCAPQCLIKVSYHDSRRPKGSVSSASELAGRILTARYAARSLRCRPPWRSFARLCHGGAGGHMTSRGPNIVVRLAGKSISNVTIIIWISEVQMNLRQMQSAYFMIMSARYWPSRRQSSWASATSIHKIHKLNAYDFEGEKNS